MEPNLSLKSLQLKIQDYRILSKNRKMANNYQRTAIGYSYTSIPKSSCGQFRGDTVYGIVEDAVGFTSVFAKENRRGTRNYVQLPLLPAQGANKFCLIGRDRQIVVKSKIGELEVKLFIDIPQDIQPDASLFRSGRYAYYFKEVEEDEYVKTPSPEVAEQSPAPSQPLPPTTPTMN